MTTISFKIAEWIEQGSIASFPLELVEATKLRILDLVGVMIASRSNPLVEAARRALLQSEGSGNGAWPLSSFEECSPTSAAFLNGIQSAVLEYDDTFIPSTIHPTGACISAVLPDCMTKVVSGKRLIEAIALGGELMCRMSIVPPVRWFDFGVHPTGVFGIFGGVAALSRLRGISREEIVNAFGAAGSMSSGLTAAFMDGTSTKMLHVGLGAANALRATALASQGITGPKEVFEGSNGWYAMHVQRTDERNWDLLGKGLGDGWESLAVATKFYPTAFTLMPHIDVALEMRKKYQIAPENIAGIDAYILKRSFSNMCEPVEVKRRPSSSWHGRISLQHTIAEALIMGKMGKDAYSEAAIHDPRINALADKVRHLPDEEGAKDYSRSGARIVMRMNDGSQFDHQIRDMRGTKNNPALIEDYLEKFRANVGDILQPQLIEQTIDAFLNLEKLDDVGLMLNQLQTQSNTNAQNQRR